MKLSFRSKLLALVAPSVEGHLDDIRRHYLPKVGLRPRLEGQFERIQRGFQDAVAASDTEKLAATAQLKKELLQQLAESSDAVDPALADALARAVEDYSGQAAGVSARLSDRESGEEVGAKKRELKAKRTRVTELLDQATVFNKAELN